jgi:C4-dicarboxylate transporter, DctQ subunit
MLNRVLERLEEWLISLCLAAATLLTVGAVVLRYGFGLGLAWAQELSIYLLIWMVLFGAAYGVRVGIHVGVDVLVRKLSTGNQRRATIAALLLGLLFAGVIAALGAKFTWFIRESGGTSNDLEWPMWIIYLAVPLGGLLMAYRFAQVLWRYIRSGELPAHGYGEEGSAP